MLHPTFQFLGQLWQLFEVSQILEFLRYFLDDIALSKWGLLLKKDLPLYGLILIEMREKHETGKAASSDNVLSTLVISKSKGPSYTFRDIRTSTYPICSIEEKKQFEQPNFTNDYVI